MPLPPGVRRLFHLPWNRARMLSDVNDEVRFHLEMRTTDLRALGLSSADAEAEALRRFGDVDDLRAHSLRTATRRRATEWIAESGRNMAFAVRRLRNSPMFTIGATLTLAIAIGATASVFGVVNGVLLRAFPFRAPERVLTVWESHPDPEQRKMKFSVLDYLDFRAQSHSFAALAAGGFGTGTVSGAGEPERVGVAAITPNYFTAMGITPVLGRGFGPDSSGPDEVVIGHGYWQRHFGGAASAIGQKLTVEGAPFVVVGVMPAGLPGTTDLWFRLTFQGSDLIHRDWHSIFVFGRLAPGVTADGAQRELQTIARRLDAAYPKTNADWSVFTIPLVDELVGQVRPALILVLAAAACVLLIGASNLANLFLVRLLSREREIAVRTALGATRGRLIRELLAEAAILGVTAGAAGIGVAAVGVRVLRALAPATLPRLDQVGLDGRVVAFCALSSIATVLIFGVLPAWNTSRGGLSDALKAGARGGTASARQQRMQSALVILQVVVALVLLTGAGILTESFERFRLTDEGFRPDNVLTARVALTGARYTMPEQVATFASTTLDRLSSLPGVTSAAVTSLLPIGAIPRYPFIILGDPRPEPGHEPDARAAFVTPEYLSTMGIALKRGRRLLPTDDRRAQRVAVVDERLVRMYFGARDPIGRLLFIPAPDTETIQVVGVVSQVKQGGLIADDVPWMYTPLDQAPKAFDVLAVVLRTSRDPSAQTAALRQAIFTIDPTAAFFDARTMDARVAESVGTPRFSTFLASLFAAVALILGAIGIYSVMTYSVSQRQREIGVRIALGASRGNVLADVLRRALVLAGIGILLGSAVSWVLTRTLATLVVGVSLHDPVIFLGAATAFALIALAAASVPAFRTTRISPVVALTSN